MADYTGNAVKFKLGTQASLNTLKDSQKGWEVGTFYLTSDSSRLYIGHAISSALSLKDISSINLCIIARRNISPLNITNS